MITTCTQCGEVCQSEDSYSDCCNEPAETRPGGTIAAVSPEGNLVVIAQYSHRDISDPEGYERNGAWNGHAVVSDAEGGL
jgi:hypothetical protein